MYSFDERKRAIERLIELDWDYKATVKDLGYPTQAALKGWAKTCLEKGKIPLSKFDEDTDPHFYNDQQRCRAVRYYFAHGRSLRAAISVLGYPDIQTLKAWIANLAVLGLKKTEEDICQGLTHNVRDDSSDKESYMDEIPEEQLLTEIENLKRKNIELKRENERVQLEIDVRLATLEILKKEKGTDPNRLTNQERRSVSLTR